MGHVESQIIQGDIFKKKGLKCVLRRAISSYRFWLGLSSNFSSVLRKTSKLRNISWQKLFPPTSSGIFNYFSQPLMPSKEAASKKSGIWKEERDKIAYYITDYKHDLNCKKNRKEVRILASASLWMSTSGSNYSARINSVIRCSQGVIVLVHQKFCFAESDPICMNYQFSDY